MQELAAKNNAKTISTQHRYVTLKKFDIGSCLPLLSILRLVQLENIYLLWAEKRKGD